jgi:Right handed beta helix region
MPRIARFGSIARGRVISVAAVLTAALLVGLVSATNSAGRPSRLSANSQGTVVPVSDPSQFPAALAKARPGDTLALADGSYPVLNIAGRSYTKPLTISGSREAHIAGMLIDGSSNIVIRGVTVEPPGDTRAVVAMRRSSRITLDHVLIDGRVESAGAFVSLDSSDSGVTVENSELTNCGSGNRCLAPDANGLRVLANNFHDCLDCDFMRGSGSNVVIEGNTFDRAIIGACKAGPSGCNHNDHIQIMGGGPWTITDNRFGDRENGAADVFVSRGIGNTTNPIHDVLVASNLFKASSAAESGFFAVMIAEGKGIPPVNVSVINNTILAGTAGAIALADPFANLSPQQRPLIANNILGIQKNLCTKGRAIHNLVIQGSACPGDTLGPAELDPQTEAPTKLSSLVINAADPAYAPVRDLLGKYRRGAPDIGAIEYRGLTLGVTAPRSLVLRRSQLAKLAWHVVLPLHIEAAHSLHARLMRSSGRTLLSNEHQTAGKSRVTVSFVIPASARRARTLVLVLEVVAVDGNTVTRTVTLGLTG